MQIVFTSLGSPADEVVPGLDLPGGRAPSQTGHGPVTYKGHVLEMVAHDLAVAQVMVLLDQGIVQRFIGGVSDRSEFNSGQIFQAVL